MNQHPHAGLIDRLYEACRVLRRLPDGERRFLTAGSRGSWPEVVLTFWEAYGQEAPKMRMPPPSSASIDRMEESLGWIAWLAAQDRQKAKCVWLCCGEGRPIMSVTRIVGLHRNTVRLERDAGLRLISAHFRVENQKVA